MLKITAVGNLGRDMEVKEFKDTHVGNFTIGVSVGYGENKATEWIRCAIWGKRAKSLEPYLTKGKKVVVIGSGSLSTFEGKDGESRTSLELKVDQDGLSFASSKNESEKPKDNSTPNAYAEIDSKPFEDDEIPF